MISTEEMQRRRAHVRAAIADSRIEGMPPPSRPEQDILDAYIRGEIEAADLLEAYKKREGGEGIRPNEAPKPQKS